jgi:hypothetical protein
MRGGQWARRTAEEFPEKCRENGRMLGANRRLPLRIASRRAAVCDALLKRLYEKPPVEQQAAVFRF